MHRIITLKSLYVLKSQGKYVGFLKTALCSSSSNGAEVFSKLRTRHGQWEDHRVVDFVEHSPLPCDKISHGTNRKIDDIVHVTVMNGLDHRAPFVALTPVGVESRKVQGGITCRRAS